MIRNLAETSEPVRTSAQVCVIGGGIAGLLLAMRLRKAGIDVVLLESGAAEQTATQHPLNRAVSIGRPYHGAMQGRARCLGGTSTMWGGALIPFLSSDLEARPCLGLPAWPVELGDLEPYLRDAERLFGAGPSSYGPEFADEAGLGDSVPPTDADFVVRFAKWPPFKKRNVATLFKREIETDPDLTIWLNATVTSFDLDRATGVLRSVTASGPDGRRLEVRARQFAVCAGAIESTRLLMLLDRQNDGRVFACSPALGRYFHDHVSMAAGRLDPARPSMLNRMAGFRFVGGAMRSLRFELSPSAQRAERVASAFAHISFEPLGPSGFDVLRDVLRGLQKHGRVGVSSLAALPRHMPYLLGVGYWRLARRQLLWPRPARYDMNIVAEQVPQASNRILLGEEMDVYGCPVPVIDWQIENATIDTIRACARRLDAYWARHGRNDVARIAWAVEKEMGVDGVPEGSISDIYHPGGTTRMGREAQTSVVNANLQTHAVSNLSVASTSVFPSGASANPTFMLMGFALRLADHLAHAATR